MRKNIGFQGEKVISYQCVNYICVN